MTLYRAIYQRRDSTLRPMTYAARDAEHAALVAAQWACGDRLLTVRMDRELQAPLLTLEA